MVKRILSTTATLLFASAALLCSCSDDNKSTPEPTPPTPPTPPEESALVMVNTTKVLYYGDRKTAGIYNYYLGLCDTEFIKDEQGDDAAPEGGHLIFFDIYSSVGSESFETAVLPNGIYTLTSDKAHGTMNDYYTRLQIWKEGKQVSVDFTDGSLTVEDSSKGKLLQAEFTLADGETLKCTYEGALVFGDPDAGSDAGIPALKEPVNANLVWAGGIYYGDPYSSGSDNFLISFTTAPLNAEGMMSAAGYNIVLSVFAEPNESFIALAPGTYIVNDTYGTGTIEPGEFVMDYIGSYCVKVDGEADAVGLSLISGGTVKISDSGMGYKVEFDLTTPEGIAIKGVYDGEIEFEDKSSGGESTTTLEGDYTLDLSKAVAELTYYGDFYGSGKANWLLSLVDETGDTVDIDLLTEPSSTTVIPLPEKGQYNMSVDYGVGVVAGENSPLGGMLGTWYMDLSTMDADGYIYGYAAAIDGNVKLSKANDTYTVKFEFVDENWNLFDGEWSGTLPVAKDESSKVSGMKKSAASAPKVALKRAPAKAAVKAPAAAKRYYLPISEKMRIL